MPVLSVWLLVGHGFQCVCVFVFAAAGEPAGGFPAGVFCGGGYGPGCWTDGLSGGFVYGIHGKDDFLLPFS